MRLSVRTLLTAGVLVGTVSAAADPPYVGKWKFNAARSQLTGDTAAIEKTPDGMMQFSSQGYVYKFRPDGKEYPAPDGGTTAWTATAPDTWDVTNRLNGKVTTTYRLVVKGDMLAVSGKMTKPDGTPATFTAAYKRMSGGPGFAGRWMSTEVKPPLTLLEISAAGSDGLSMNDDGGPLFSGQFDGKDNPALGRMSGSKYTATFRRQGGSAFEMTVKIAGKPMYVETYSVSPDGKVLTVNGTPANAAAEKYVLVFDRQ
jgi:hypothetical protein